MGGKCPCKDNHGSDRENEIFHPPRTVASYPWPDIWFSTIGVPNSLSSVSSVGGSAKLASGKGELALRIAPSVLELPIELISRLKGDTSSCKLCREEDEELSMGNNAGRKSFELATTSEAEILMLEVELMVESGGREAGGRISGAMLRGGGGGFREGVVDLVDDI